MKEYCSIPVFNSLRVHSLSHTSSCWQLKVFPYSTWNCNWSATEERCHWCMEPSVTLPWWYWHQLCCCFFQCRSVLQNHHRLVSLLLQPGLTIEIISVVTMNIIILWDVTTCSLILIYRHFGGMFPSSTNPDSRLSLSM